MRALRNVAVLLGFCKILDIVKLHIVKTTITILSQTIYIAHPYVLPLALVPRNRVVSARGENVSVTRVTLVLWIGNETLRSFTHRERPLRDRVWTHISHNSLADGATPSLTQWRRQVILANAPSTPQISLPKRTLSAAWGAWQRTQCLVPYSENKGYASNPRRSLS